MQVFSGMNFLSLAASTLPDTLYSRWPGHTDIKSYHWAENSIGRGQDYQFQELHGESLNPHSPYPSLRIQGEMEKTGVPLGSNGCLTSCTEHLFLDIDSMVRIGSPVRMSDVLSWLTPCAHLCVYAYFQIRSETVATYALCGFANIGSLGIVIGGLSKWKECSSTTDMM